MSQLRINRYLDHAILKPEMMRDEVIEAIQLGVNYRVKTVCVRPCDIDLAIQMCQGTETDVCCVLGFPHGVVPGEIKAAEAMLYVKKGVKEIDMVVNYSYVRSGLWDKVEQDIQAVCEVTQPAGVTLKVILESSMLTLDEVRRTTEIAIGVGADFVKTSTGFNGPGATEEVVRVMLETARGRIQVKPSGGIRDAQRARMFIEMGCHRLGVNYTSTAAICDGISISDASKQGY